MFLGVEIGGTKLQLGVSETGEHLVEMVRREVASERQADGIREQILSAGKALIDQYPVHRVGFGFGGPVDHQTGRVRTSHQVDGWMDFPLTQWCQEELGVPATIGNDCDVAALAESHFGAGRGSTCTFYMTVGTGIGGGLVIDGQGVGRGRPSIAEIGHLRPGLEAVHPNHTVESLAAGPGIERRFNLRLSELPLDERQNYPESATGQQIAELAHGGDPLATAVVDETCRVIGWAIAQVVTLVSPEVVVIGGGVALMGESLFFAPIRHYAEQFGFAPMSHGYQIVPAELGESVVVHGACALGCQSYGQV